jgi:acyl-CoA synthetase (AMP-forming)/AMP-acid ligase II
MGLLDWLEEPSPERGIHISRDGGSWDFTSHVELALGVRLVAAALFDAGVARDSTVSLLVTNEASFAAALMGSLLAGATAAPLPTPALGAERGAYAKHIAAVLDVASPSAVLVEPSLREHAEAALAQIDGRCPVIEIPERDADAPAVDDLRRPPAGLALVQFTSGSTARPKGVRIPWHGLEANLRAIRRWLDWRDGDAMGTWLPLHHDMGLIGTLLTPLTAGCSTWQVPPIEFVRDPARWLAIFGEGRANATMSPTFGYGYAAKRVPPEALSGWDFSAWRTAVIGAERVTPDALARFVEATAPRGFDAQALVPAYGLAEATLAVTGVRVRRRATAVRLAASTVRLGDAIEVEERCDLGDPVEDAIWLTGCGASLEGLDVDVVAADGTTLEDGRVGEIRVRGTSLADGYQVSATSVNSFPASGFTTGDAGFLLGGELFVIGRLGDSVSVAGRNIFAEDIDAALAAEVGLQPGRYVTTLGDTPSGPRAAILITGNAAALDRVILMARQALGPEVRLVVFTGQRGAILRTSSGKPRRRAMFTAMVEHEIRAEVVYDSGTASEREAEVIAP